MQVLNPNPQAIYTGISNALVRISSAEGVRTLWRGVSSMVVGAGPSHALYFATYERCKERFGVDSTNDQHYPLATGNSFPFNWSNEVCSNGWFLCHDN